MADCQRSKMNVSCVKDRSATYFSSEDFFLSSYMNGRNHILFSPGCFGNSAKQLFLFLFPTTTVLFSTGALGSWIVHLKIQIRPYKKTSVIRSIPPDFTWLVSWHSFFFCPWQYIFFQSINLLLYVQQIFAKTCTSY